MAFSNFSEHNLSYLNKLKIIIVITRYQLLIYVNLGPITLFPEGILLKNLQQRYEKYNIHEADFIPPSSAISQDTQSWKFNSITLANLIN